MKRKLILILFLTIYIFPAIAQSNQQPGASPIAKPVAKGIWIYLGKTLPKNFHYVVERKKEGTHRYEKLAEITSPVNESEMVKRQQDYQKYFENLDAFNASGINNLWKYLMEHTTIDSMYSNNFAMMHLLAGTAWLDSTAESKSGYVYRISAVATGNKVLSEKETNLSSSLQKVALPKINFSYKKYADGKLSLSWAVKEKLDMAHFNVYRTVFGTDTYKKENVIKGIYFEKDSLKLQVIDSIGLQPAWYEYQIAAVDAFGNEGEMQGYVSGSNIEEYYTPPVTHFKSVNTQRNHQVKLSWHYQHKKYLNGIDIMRSMNYDSGFIRIATVPVSDSSFTDILPVSGENYYYYLLLQSAGNAPIPTAKIFANYTDNSSQPEPPNEMDAVTIPRGIKVYWKSEEPFAKGFYVYRRNHPDDAFSQVSTLVPAGAEVYSFTDTSKALQAGEAYDYVVRTINEDNQLSIHSDTITANPGIHKPMAAPMNLRFRNSDGSITILWDDMRKWESDLVGYKIFRRMGNSGFVRLPNDSLRPEKNFYVDSTIQPGNNYAYAVITWDVSGSESERSVILIPVVSDELPGAPSGIRVSQSGDDVYITWGQIAGDVKSVNIYRSEPGVAAKWIATVTDADFFNDKEVKKGKLYFYQIAPVSHSNKEGAISEKVSLRLK